MDNEAFRFRLERLWRVFHLMKSEIIFLCSNETRCALSAGLENSWLAHTPEKSSEACTTKFSSSARGSTTKPISRYIRWTVYGGISALKHNEHTGFCRIIFLRLDFTLIFMITTRMKIFFTYISFLQYRSYAPPKWNRKPSIRGGDEDKLIMCQKCQRGSLLSDHWSAWSLVKRPSNGSSDILG